MLLSLALLPLGMIAVWQTYRVAHQAEQSARLALIGRTSEASASERGLIQTALGAAQALGPSVLDRLADPEACRAVLSEYVRNSVSFIFAGFIGMDGRVLCASSANITQLAGDGVAPILSFGRPMISVSRTGLVTGASVLLITEPIVSNGVQRGSLVISLPHRTIERLFHYGERLAPEQSIIFNERGQILSATGGLATAAGYLPRSGALTSYIGSEDHVFTDRTAAGQRRTFVVVPLIPGLAYALGVWPVESALGRADHVALLALTVPILMWIAGLAVAYFAVHYSVIRPVRALRGSMRRFAIGRRDAPVPVLKGAPYELREVAQTFQNLTRIIARDETELEASVAEKTVLLKEVHHRVKNNLQLITSITNMQIRKVREPEARRVLKSIQDRVMSLATIHRNLYQAETLSAVRADVVIGEIINQMIVLAAGPGTGLDVTTDIAAVTLTPDQTVPLSLLATEGITNAVKYAGGPDGRRNVRVTLDRMPDDRVTFRIVNSRGGDPETPAGTGLGAQLIDAFASQLDGTVSREVTEDRFELSVSFRVAAFEPM